MNPKLEKFIQEVKDKNIHIAGLSGSEGAAVAQFLVRCGVNQVVGHDFQAKETFKKGFYQAHTSLSPKDRQRAFKDLLNLPITIRFQEEYLKDILEADLIFTGQNWFNYPANYPHLLKAKEKGLPFSNITQLYLRLAPGPVVGITGTKGKTTTGNLLLKILNSRTPESKQASKAYLSGNDRTRPQILNVLGEMKTDDILILEISNRQLTDLGRSPHIGVLTNISADHIEEHGSFDAYRRVKGSLFSHQTRKDWAVINYDDPFAREIGSRLSSKVFPYSRQFRFTDRGVFIEEDHPKLGTPLETRRGKVVAVRDGASEVLFEANDLRLIGGHNLENALAAASAAKLLGVEVEAIKAGIKTFQGVKGRLEFVREVAGVRYYNDMSSTTPASTMAALKALSGEPIILIAGGDEKGGNYAELARVIKEKVKRVVFLPGTATDRLKIYLSDFGYLEASDLSTAVKYTLDMAVLGDTVLLSPAGARFASQYVTDKEGFSRLIRKIANR
ncbi:MAG: UDP-N-acetylmuramoyl-L-alanine--D-glutamate ligase [bacterium]